jgi:hypothetical protein
VVAETPFLPLEHGSRPNETKPVAPIGPQTRETRSAHPIARLDPESARSASLVDGELMTQRNNLHLKRQPPAERGDEEVHQCKAECSHGRVEWLYLGARSQAALRRASAIEGSRWSGTKVSPNQCVRIFGTHNAWAANMKRLLQQTCATVARSERQKLTWGEYKNLQKRYHTILPRSESAATRGHHVACPLT